MTLKLNACLKLTLLKISSTEADTGIRGLPSAQPKGPALPSFVKVAVIMAHRVTGTIGLSAVPAIIPIS